MATYLEHANIAVRDMNTMIRFLQTAFPDFRVRADVTERGGGRWVHVGTDETYLALNVARDAGAAAHAPYSGTPGVEHLGYVVDDVDALRQRLTAAGYRESTVQNKHPHRKRIYFNDPEGNDWEFVQYYSDDRSERNDYKLPNV